MTAVAVARSSLTTSLTRYARSRGLWLLLLAGPVGARFMVARDDGSGIQIAIGQHLPVMTSAVLGISLGIVVSTLLLPIAFLYLRSNVTRRQPWQVEEVTTASRVAITLGRFAADVIVLFGMLSTLTLAGVFLGFIIVTGPVDPWRIAAGLWLVAAPAVTGLAAFHALLGALPATRRGWGDALFFFVWLTSLTMPIAVSGQPSSFAANMYDFAGFVRPLVGPAPSGKQDFAIGSGDVAPGRVPLDVERGIAASGYLASRLAWAAIAVLLAVAAGLAYRPHPASQRQRNGGRLARLVSAGPPPAVVAGTLPAAAARLPFIGLVLAEARLIGAGRLFVVAIVLAAAAGLVGDYRHIGAPAALLPLVFGLAAQAGRSEAKGLLSLTGSAVLSPAARRLAFVLAGTGWAALLAAPAALVRLSLEPLLLMATVGGAAAALAILLATLSGSSFAPRLVLLVLWYGFLSS